MKIIVIGDIHGRDIRKQIVNQDFDKVVFVGDYFDSFDISIANQIQNFKDILEFRDNNKDKVELLCGNHDRGYIDIDNAQCSGFSMITYLQIKDLISKAGLTICYDIHRDNLTLLYRISHAGFTKKTSDEWVNYINKFDWNNSAEWVKAYMKTLNNMDGPLRIRPSELNKDLPDHKQIFGHTQIDNIILGDNINIDCLHNGQYLVIENGIVSVQFI